MQTKSRPPFLSWPLGNCLISNFGKGPEGRESCFLQPLHQISHVFTARGGSCQVRTRYREPLATRRRLHKAAPSLCIQECVYICMYSRARAAAAERPLPRSAREGEFEKTGTAVCAVCLRHAAEKTKQNITDVLFLEFRSGKSSSTESGTLRACLESRFTTFNHT